MGQKKDPIALKEYVFSHLLVTEKCITCLFKTHHFSFSTGWDFVESIHLDTVKSEVLLKS